MLFEALLYLLAGFTSDLFSPTAEIIFAGDAMQHQGQLDAARRSGGVYDFSECFAEVDSIVKAADYAVVNLETPVASRRFGGYPCFCAPVSYAESLKDAGFDLFLTANNHTLDRGSNGLCRTIEVLDSLEIKHIGTYVNPDARNTDIPYLADINGFKVAFLNYTYGTNGFTPSGDVVVDYIDKDRIAEDIAKSRENGAEIVCVTMHWGEEYKLLPVASEKTMAKYLIDQGVDIIYGGHPHVIQPMKMVYNPTTGKPTALFYSLGNFISNMKTRDTRGGAMAKVTLKRDLFGNAYVDGLAYRLIFTVPSDGKTNYKVYPAEKVTDNPNCRDFINSAESIFFKHNISVTPWK